MAQGAIFAGLVSVSAVLLGPAAPATGQCESAPPAKLTASDAAAQDYFGDAVAISGDVAIVGSIWDDDHGSASGSVYVYRRIGFTWVEEQKLTAPDGAPLDYFGDAVSIDGDAAVVGVWADDDNGMDSGSAYFFRYDGSAWVQEAKLTATDNALDDRFGNAVKIRGDVAIIGAFRDDHDADDSGSAYVFRYDGATWVQEAKLTASDAAAFENFGGAVSIDGDVAVVSAPHSSDPSVDSGSAYIFRHVGGGVWVEEQKITSTNGAVEDNLGWGLSISGEAAAISVHGEDPNGAVYVYRHDGTMWAHEATITSSDGTVLNPAVSLDGDVLVVGAFAGGGPGSAFVFRHDGSAWVEETKLTAPDGAPGDRFAERVGLSGALAIFGADHDDDGGNATGSAYVFDLSCLPDCPADLDGSGDVGFGDLLLVLSAWGGDGPADVDGSGVVDFGDLLDVLSAWGPCPQPGACCLPDGACEEADFLGGGDCVAQGGVYHGDGTACGDVSCPQPGACCLPTGACIQASLVGGGACVIQNGVYAGDDTLCIDVSCPPPGGCCFPSGACADLPEAVCTAQGGVFAGDGSACASGACDQGACCLPGGACLLVPPDVCGGIGGAYQGNGTSCASITCP